MRDYRIHSSTEKTVLIGGSAFNVKARSLRMGNFSRDEVLAPLAQYTEETGQRFRPAAAERVRAESQGQPWLVNALADETRFRHRAGRDRRRPIEAEDVVNARERLVARRETHLDQLADKFREDRVRRAVEPLLSGGEEREFSASDVEYVRDLGLVALDQPLRIANPYLRRGRAARADSGDGGGAGAGDGVVRGRQRRARLGKARRRLPGVLPRALRALGGALRLPRGRTASSCCRRSSTGS